MNRVCCLLTSFLMLSLDAAAQQPLLRNYSVNVENDVIHSYMMEVSYEQGEASCIAEYFADAQGTLHHPRPVTIELPDCQSDSVSIICHLDTAKASRLTFRVPTAGGTAELSNFVPNLTYDYEVTDGSHLLQVGSIQTSGQVRMMNIEGKTLNVRDLGGWKTEDGKKRIRYGKVIRGSELNWEHMATEEGLRQLVEIGVGAEIDLRAHRDAEANNHGDEEGVSVFGFTDEVSTPDGEVASYLYTNDSGMLTSNLTVYSWTNRWRQEFQFIVKNLRAGRNIYMHCTHGRDRTGYLSMLLEGLLGLSYSDIIKDYELSFLSMRLAYNKATTIDRTMAFFNKLSGATLRDKFESYFRNYLLISQSDIDYFRSVMLEDVAVNIVTEVGGPAADAAPEQTGIYDLTGRRVRQPQSGKIYISNEKKTMR